jgi:hypothetical protein
MDDATDNVSQPTDRETEGTSQLQGEEHTLSWNAILSGVQVGFPVPEVPASPKSVRSLKDKHLRQRAEEAWKSISLLQAAITLWKQFLVCCQRGWRLRADVEERIIQLFSNLNDLGAVVEAFVADSPLIDSATTERGRIDEALRLHRIPIRQLDERTRNQYRTIGLYELTEAFRLAIRTHAHCLKAAGVKSEIFERPDTLVEADLNEITRVDLDLTGDGLPLDFGRALRNLVRQPRVAALQRELERLRSILEESPTLTLQDADPRKWYHTDPPPGPLKWHGTINGSLKEIAARIDIDEKTLRNHNRAGILWVRKAAGQQFQVWFRTNDEYSAAFARSVPPNKRGKKREKKGIEGEKR